MPTVDPFHFLIVVAFAIYAITLLALMAGLQRTNIRIADSTPFVSIVVAARNEERFLPKLLEHLSAQQYPSFEIIIANDRSTDRTPDIVQEAARRDARIRLVTIDRESTEMPAKKHALTRAIEASRGEILAFTDADCLPPPTWLSAIVSCFTPSVGLVAGYSPYEPDTFGMQTRSVLRQILFEFIRYEEFKGALWSAGSIGIGHGWLCTGRNLAYRRSVWNEVGGFTGIRHSVSGDDDLFLLMMRKETAWDIRYISSPESHVPTAPPPTLSTFIQQRTRHFSAGRFFPATMKAASAVFNGSNAILFAGLVGSFISPAFATGLWAFAGKSLLDLVVLLLGRRRFSVSPSLTSFLLLEIFVLVYQAIMIPLGYMGRFSWKEQRS